MSTLTSIHFSFEPLVTTASAMSSVHFSFDTTSTSSSHAVTVSSVAASVPVSLSSLPSTTTAASLDSAPLKGSTSTSGVLEESLTMSQVASTSMSVAATATSTTSTEAGVLETSPSTRLTTKTATTTTPRATIVTATSTTTPTTFSTITSTAGTTPSSFPQPNAKSTTVQTWALVGAILALALLVLVITAVFFVRRRHRLVTTGSRRGSRGGVAMGASAELPRWVVETREGGGGLRGGGYGVVSRPESAWTRFTVGLGRGPDTVKEVRKRASDAGYPLRFPVASSVYTVFPAGGEREQAYETATEDGLALAVSSAPPFSGRDLWRGEGWWEEGRDDDARTLEGRIIDMYRGI